MLKRNNNILQTKINTEPELGEFVTYCAKVFPNRMFDNKDYKLEYYTFIIGRITYNLKKKFEVEYNKLGYLYDREFDAFTNMYFDIYFRVTSQFQVIYVEVI